MWTHDGRDRVRPNWSIIAVLCLSLLAWWGIIEAIRGL